MDNQTLPEGSEPTRRPFDEEFFVQSNEFCTKVIKDIPELAGLAVVPLWANQPAKTPSGVLRLRNSQPPYLASLLLLLNRLAAFNVDVHTDLMTQLRMFDQYAAELATKIGAYTEQLEKLEKENE